MHITSTQCLPLSALLTHRTLSVVLLSSHWVEACLLNLSLSCDTMFSKECQPGTRVAYVK